MPVELKNRRYFSVNEVLVDTGVSRQTLWRWRQDGKVPAGHRFRDRQLLFDEEDLDAIRSYASHVEPVQSAGRQLRLFRNGVGDERTPDSGEGKE
jgi:predicted DNA-binding transcriptional regulator AlpA